MAQRAPRRSAIGHLLVTILTAAMLAGGCGRSRVTHENMKKIDVDMPQAEVEKMLGGPGQEVPNTFGSKMLDNVRYTNSSPEAKTYAWTDGPNTIRVLFINGKASDHGITGPAAAQ